MAKVHRFIIYLDFTKVQKQQARVDIQLSTNITTDLFLFYSPLCLSSYKCYTRAGSAYKITPPELHTSSFTSSKKEQDRFLSMEISPGFHFD